MRGWRRSIAIASVLLALLPAAAVAQSAGDEQYADPFGDEQGQTEQAAPTPAATQAPATGAQPAQATQAPAAAPAASNAPAQAAQLPRTGWDAGVPGALGLVLMSAGVALRARVRRSP
jgi:hypothetical protein